jgi:FAD/FMN-containing dehydrogenase
VIKPTSANEVSTAIKWANANSLPFTVCGGGHSTSGQSSKGPEGVVVDLSLMRDVAVDPVAQTITYGGGCLWADVDEAAAEHGLATPGGTVNHTGVGGLVLGGGFGFLSPKHGLTIDVLLEVEAVLADGSVVTASETENADLFWALRGAGTSFAAVTRFTSRAFPQGDVWAGVLLFSPGQLAEVVAGCNAVLEGQDGNQAVLLAFGYGPPPDRSRVIVAQVFHNGSAEEGEKKFAPLLRVGPLLNAVQTVPYKAVNGLANAGVPHGGRYQFGAANVTYPVDVGVVQSAATVWWEGIDRLSADPSKEDLRGSIIGWELFPNDKTRAVAPSATAFANRGRYFNVAVLMSWKNPETDRQVRAFKQEVAALIRDKGFKGDEVGGQGVGQYNNYLDGSISAEGAFGPNAKRLKELKQKYDPANRFDKLWKLA